METVIRVGNELHHPDELVATGMCGGVLRHMVTHVPSSVPHAQRECCHGVIRHDARGNGVAPGQLCGHIGQRVDGAAEVILGRLRTQEHLKLMLQACAVEANAWWNRKDALPLMVEVQVLQHVGDDAVFAGARGCLDPLQAPTNGDDEV